MPTLWDLLSPVAERPSTFTRGSDVYDPERMGFVSGPPALGEGFVQDASVPGNGNQGHTYGTQVYAHGFVIVQLDDTDRSATASYYQETTDRPLWVERL